MRTRDVTSGARVGVAYNLQEYNTFDYLTVDVSSTDPGNKCFESGSLDGGHYGPMVEGSCPDGPPAMQEDFILEVQMSGTTAHISLNEQHLVDAPNVNPADRSVGVVVTNHNGNVVLFEPVEVYARQCESPEAPENGDVECNVDGDCDAVYAGSIATYTCDNGFFLFGDHRRTCEEGTGEYGTWSGTLPVCIVEGDCPEDPCLHGSSCNHGNNITVCTCLPGFSGDICETTEEFLLMAEPRPHQALSWYTPPPTHRIRKSCFIKIVLEGLPYASVVAESHHMDDPGTSFGFYEEGSVCNGPSTCDHVMCVEYRCNGDVYTPDPKKVLIEANITLSGLEDYTCSIRQLTPATAGMIKGEPGHILFQPVGGYEFGPVFGIYSGTGTQDEMRLQGQSYCQLGKNSGHLGGDENIENAAVYITCSP